MSSFHCCCRHLVGRTPASRSCPLSADAASELDVLRHDGHAFRVDGAQVGVFEQADLRIRKRRKFGANTI